MNKEEVKKALDSFENDEYVDAKDKLKQIVRTKLNTHLKDKLGLGKDAYDIEKEEEEEEEGED